MKYPVRGARTLGYIVKQRPRYGFSQKSDSERPIQDDCRGIHRRGVMPELRLCPGDGFYPDVPGQAVLRPDGGRYPGGVGDYRCYTRIRRVKEERRRVEEQEERGRRARIERDMRMSTEAKRRKKEAEERAEEKKRELAERRVREREKRLKEYRHLEQWRAEQARIKEEELGKEEAERARERGERNKRVEQMAARVKWDKTKSMLIGWATIQIISTSRDKGRAVEEMARREADCLDIGYAL
ncbi:uncharacterized protein EV420DRAFT_1680366 [Desarmillaria tabescens]|uniref:Uncharacterized protein n=1 Tax=Armillaria tabescens TaxID=1929756 RepID=A0AA39KC60_ARMTA|nr:uncharacterized protein EV420DRAFT_1680366 [Desarmillaria tabescens]KAK0458410.1 hypothetical protein EV420DRAFT_1680366 [Desarmillaria tabescens]